MENRFENFTFLILRASKLVQELKTRAMAPYGLKAVHVMCLHYLRQNPSGLTGSDLARRALEDKAAISRALRLLQDRGYINYQTGERNSLATLTDTGREMADYIASVAKEAVDAGGAGISEEDREVFYETLRIISENLSQHLKETTLEEEKVDRRRKPYRSSRWRYLR